ncbi:HAD-IIB family hydrolase [Granulicoccus phenolivorans]|uniref:HAD-IIB family hydrolase n=1 Tax=Granulicoccus phenolivorans TaxID=266854 RepID=UPI00041203FE|nr:HAD-IIB family hydrolase [Granulicoccus phenolivorans]
MNTDLPKLIATDLDGTFLSPDGTVSELNLRAVLAAAEAGIAVVFATGRPPRWLNVINELPIAPDHPLATSHTEVIASNGALLWDLTTDSQVHAEPVDAGVAREVITEVRRLVPGSAFAVECGIEFGYEPTFHTLMSTQERRDPRFLEAPAEELVARPIVKLLVQNLHHNGDDLAAAVHAAVGDTVTVTHSMTTSVGLVELSAPGISKASMLARYAAEKGIDPADVAAFGDMPNDRSMLDWAGRPHVMAQAHESLDSVGVRIGSNADSGVGRTILSWLA